jgi:hypothetical protein
MREQSLLPNDQEQFVNADGAAALQTGLSATEAARRLKSNTATINWQPTARGRRCGNFLRISRIH